MQFLEEIERVFYESLDAAQAATPDVDGLRQVAQTLWDELGRYGPPSMPQFPQSISIPGIGDFNVPTVPQYVPPPPKTFSEKLIDWVKKHPWVLAGLATGALGATGYAGYGVLRLYQARTRRVLRLAARDRRQVVVVLGGDSALGLPLILDLEQQGYIVVTSVPTPEAGTFIEQRSRGYVRALILDPNELGTIPIFLRSLASTLSRRFPITATGDPHASPASYPYVHSVISLLTLPPPITPTPLENLAFRSSYLPYLSATHIAPLQVIQALLPLLRTTSARGQDYESEKKNIVFCLPATDTRIGLPFCAAASMSAAATLRAAEVLRREIAAVSLTDKTESMKGIKVVVVDVGSIATHHSSAPSLSPAEAYAAMENWTASEKVVYGPALAGVTQRPVKQTLRGSARGMKRKPTDVAVFTDTLIGVVSNGTKGGWTHGIGLGLGTFTLWGRMRNVVRGERFAVGAGAGTYRIASHLPALLLDIILNIPHFLIGMRNALMVRVGVVTPPSNDLPLTVARRAPPPMESRYTATPETPARRPLPAEPPRPSTLPGPPESVYESDSSVDSSHDERDHAEEGYRQGSDVDASWVSLNGC